MVKTLLYRIKGKFQNIGANWDKLAPSEEQAIDYAHNHINQEPQRMIDVYHFSLYCLAHSGESVNKHYRQNRQDDIDLQIGDMVSQHTTDTDLVLYRGVCDYIYDLMKENAKNMPDCDLYEKGFLACSLVKGHEINSRTKLRIYMGNVNEEQGFYEVDVMHGSKLKIISIDDEYINCQLLATV